ncbi:MAG: hypothetical protein AAFU70_05700 [Planctomycetota bacterium]
MAEDAPAAGFSETIETELGPGEVRERLRTLSRRGKLPGFEPKGDGGRSTAFGAPFDSSLVIGVEETGAGARVALSLERRLRLPLVFGAVFVLAIWPGEPLTDSLLKTYFESYDRWTQEWLGGWFGTWMWYYPLTVPFLPPMFLGMLKKSRLAAAEHARELGERIRAVLA